jgi:hypothetical protein
LCSILSFSNTGENNRQELRDVHAKNKQQNNPPSPPLQHPRELPQTQCAAAPAHFQSFLDHNLRHASPFACNSNEEGERKTHKPSASLVVLGE